MMKSPLTVSEIAGCIDHAILHPTITDAEVEQACDLALQHKIAALCIKPYHTALAKRLLGGSKVGICAVIGFPHGNSTTEVKEFETVRVIDDGATEVDMVVNLGKVLQRDWKYVSFEIATLNHICIQKGALLKIIFENDFIPDDTYKIKLCEIANEHQVAFVKTSTGFGYVKNEDGHYHYLGATENDIRLMRMHCLPEIEIKASGGIKNLDHLLRMYELGARRIGTSSTEAILQEASQRFGNP